MPLKDVDLKTFEAYKKAIRLDLPKISHGTRFWIYRDVELPNATGKKQKIPSFIALVDNKAIKPLLQGKALICKGTCGMEDGKVAFEAETGQVPYRLLKTSVPFLLGKMVHIPSGKEEDSGDEATEEEQPASGPSAAAGLTTEWNKLVKDMQAAAAAHPERKEALTRMAAGVPDLIKDNKVGDARQRMDALARMLSSAPSPSTGLTAAWNKLVKDMQAAATAHPELRDALSKAAAGIPDLIKNNKIEEAKQKMEAVQKLLDRPASSGAAPGGAELTTRWNTLVKQMQAAIAAHPDKKADLVRAAAGIPDMIRTGKLDLAKKLMDGVDSVLKAAPASDAAKASATPEPKDTDREDSQRNDAAAKTEFEGRFLKVDERVQAILKEGAGDVSRIRSVSGVAGEKAAAGDYAAALKALDQLETLLDQADDVGTSKEGAPHEGLVKYRRALYEFAKAKDLVAKQISALKKAIPATLPGETALANEVASNLMEWNEELSELVNDAINDSEDEDDPISEEVRAGVAKYLNDVTTDKLIRHADQNTFDVPVSIAATLGAALRNIQQAMPARAANA